MSPAEPINTGDVVVHGPSGEEWVVAYVRGERLSWVGWPEGLAEVSDCKIVSVATPAVRDALLQQMAKSDGLRGVYARERLAEKGR